MKKIQSTIITSIALLLLSLLGTPSAHAVSVTPYACMDMGWHYRTFNPVEHFEIMSGPKLRGPGGVFDEDFPGTYTTQQDFIGDFDFSKSTIVAVAESTFGKNLTLSSTTSGTFNFKSAIPLGAYLDVAFGYKSIKFEFEKYYLNSFCQKTTSHFGSVKKLARGKIWDHLPWEIYN
jgi:hypothetical protein